jgi:hypothetical protein
MTLSVSKLHKISQQIEPGEVITKETSDTLKMVINQLLNSVNDDCFNCDIAKAKLQEIRNNVS